MKKINHKAIQYYFQNTSEVTLKVGRYDVSLKDFVSEKGGEFLRFLGFDVKDIETTNVEFPAGKERRVDRVFKGTVEGKKVLIHIEFQLQYQASFA